MAPFKKERKLTCRKKTMEENKKIQITKMLVRITKAQLPKLLQSLIKPLGNKVSTKADILGGQQSEQHYFLKRTLQSV